MATIEITKNQTRGVVVYGAVFGHDILSAAGAVAYAKGTILGRVTATGHLTHYAAGAADGTEVPLAILAEEQVFTGAGTRPISPVIGGQVDSGMLVIHGTSDSVTPALADKLRDFTIITAPVEQLTGYDNE